MVNVESQTLEQRFCCNMNYSISCPILKIRMWAKQFMLCLFWVLLFFHIFFAVDVEALQLW